MADRPDINEEERMRALFNQWHAEAPPPDRVYEIMRNLFDEWHAEAHQQSD